MTTIAVPQTSGVASTIDRFLEAASAGDGIPEQLFSPDVVLDATVPGWRFTDHGADAVARRYSGWFTEEAHFEELERLPLAGGEVVTYLLVWAERGVPHAARHCHVLRLAADDRIAADQFFCGGRWDAGLLADMAAASDAG